MFGERLLSYSQFKSFYSEKELKTIFDAMTLNLYENKRVEVDMNCLQCSFEEIGMPVNFSGLPIRVFISFSDMEEIMYSGSVASKLMRLMYMAYLSKEDSADA